MERLEALTNYYTTHNEDARLAPKRGMVEFLTTIHYVEKYLKPGMRILEIGAGTGRYSHYFAQNGYDVDAVELLLGPMYHLYTDEDKLAAMSEAIRVTKKGGIVFAAYCNNDITVYHFGFLRGGFNTGEHNDLINFETFKLSSTPKEVFALYRQEDVNELMSHFRTERLHYVGTDMLTRFIGGTVDEMNEKTFEMYMKYHLCICERKDMVGATAHMLDIFRKE